MLTQRQQSLLTKVVEDFALSGTPVGSKALLANHHLKISSATVRNEMNKLEAEGLIMKMHASSGRVPSAKGYRYYAAILMEEYERSEGIIGDHKATADHLAQATGYLTLVSGTSTQQNISYMHITPFESSLLLLIVFQDGTVMHQTIHYQLDQATLLTLNQFLNATLADFNENGKMTRSAEIDAALLADIEQAVQSLSRHHAFIYYVAGRELLLEAIDDVTAVQQLMRYIDSHQIINKLNSMNDRAINVKIGQEIDTALKDISLVTMHVESESVTGKVAVLGPVDMRYRKVFDELSAATKGGTMNDESK